MTILTFQQRETLIHTTIEGYQSNETQYWDCNVTLFVTDFKNYSNMGFSPKSSSNDQIPGTPTEQTIQKYISQANSVIWNFLHKFTALNREKTVDFSSHNWSIFGKFCIKHALSAHVHEFSPVSLCLNVCIV